MLQTFNFQKQQKKGTPPFIACQHESGSNFTDRAKPLPLYDRNLKPVFFFCTHHGVVHMAKKQKKRGPPNFCVKKIKMKAFQL